VIALNVLCLVDKVSDATAKLGRTVAPHIRRQSNRFLPTCLTRPTCDGGTSKFDDACGIAASGLQGFFTHFHSASEIVSVKLS